MTLSGNNPQNWNGSFVFNGSNSLNMGNGAVTMNASPTVYVAANTLTVGGSYPAPALDQETAVAPSS